MSEPGSANNEPSIKVGIGSIAGLEGQMKTRRELTQAHIAGTAPVTREGALHAQEELSKNGKRMDETLRKQYEETVKHAIRMGIKI